MVAHPPLARARRGARWVAIAIALALPGNASAAPPAAVAGCGIVERAQPARPGPYRPPLAIGDSTMLLALPALAREGFQVNAHGCRQFPEALALLHGLAHGNVLPHLVVIALGADGSVGPGDVARALAVLGPGRVLVLVTPRELGGGAGSDAANVRAAGRAHPGRIRVLDWVRYAAGHGAWFQPDGLHLTFSGASAFAGFLRQVIPLGRPGPPPAPPPPAPRSCPIRAPAGPAGLDAAAPGVSLLPGILDTTQADPGKVTVGAANANPFALVGTLTISPVDPARAATTTACVALAPGGDVAVRVGLGPTLGRLLAITRRFPVRVVLRLYDSAGAAASVTGYYRLERPALRA